MGLALFLDRLRKVIVSFGFAIEGDEQSVKLTFSAFSLSSSCFARNSSFNLAMYCAFESASCCIACGATWSVKAAIADEIRVCRAHRFRFLSYLELFCSVFLSHLLNLLGVRVDELLHRLWKDVISLVLP